MTQQKQERLNSWVALAANVGVLIGLIVLIIEVRQNAALTRLSLEASKNDLLANIEFNLSDPAQSVAWIKSYRAPETMTEVELLMVQAHYVAMILQWDYMFQMHKRGLVSIDDVRAHIGNAAPIYFGSAFGKAWFDVEMQYWQGTRMHEIAGPIVAGVSPNHMRDNYSALLDLAAASAIRTEPE